MKKLTINTCIVLATVYQGLLGVHADTTSCDTDIFKKNSCEICYTGGDVSVESTKMIFPETIITWENKSENLNHNIYKASQNEASIITDLGTIEDKWYEKGIVWPESLVWSNFAGVDRYILASKQKLELRKIEKDTEVSIKNFKTSTTPVVLKVPIKYHEIETGSFTQGAEKTSNYCVSYTPKISATTQSTTTNTTSTPPTNTNTTTSNNSSSNTQNTTNTNTNTTTASNTNTTTNNTTTNTTSNNTSTTNSDTADTNTTTEDTADTSTTTINDEIPSYDAKVTLNSAGTDPTASEASKIQTGPAENMLVLMAAILLSLALFPKVNTLLNK